MSYNMRLNIKLHPKGGTKARHRDHLISFWHEVQKDFSSHHYMRTDVFDRGTLEYWMDYYNSPFYSFETVQNGSGFNLHFPDLRKLACVDDSMNVTVIGRGEEIRDTWKLEFMYATSGDVKLGNGISRGDLLIFKSVMDWKETDFVWTGSLDLVPH